jgi:large subunit ribosomal protein L10
MITKAQKAKFLEEARFMSEKCRVLGIVDMQNMPARQLAEAKRKLLNFAQIKMSRKKLIKKILEERGIVFDFKAKQPAIIFGELEPFELYRKIKENKTYGRVKPGIVVNKDVVIPKGPTGLPPGPIMTLVQKFGGKTKIEGGKVSIVEDFVALKAGEVVSQEAAELINALGLKPVEIFLDVEFLFSDKTLFKKEVLDIEPSKYAEDLVNEYRKALALAMEISWISKTTVPLMLQRGFLNAKILALESEFVDKSTIAELIKRHVAKAIALKNNLSI